MTSYNGSMVFRLCPASSTQFLALDVPGAAGAPPDPPLPVLTDATGQAAPAPTSAENWRLVYSWDDATNIGTVALVNASIENVAGPKVLVPTPGAACVAGTAPSPTDFCSIAPITTLINTMSINVTLAHGSGADGIMLSCPLNPPAGGGLSWMPFQPGHNYSFTLYPNALIQPASGPLTGPIIEWGGYQSNGHYVGTMLLTLLNMFHGTSWSTTFLPTLLFWMYDFPYINPNTSSWQNMADTQIYPLFETYVLTNTPPPGWGTGNPPPPPPPPVR
jgi:hypothetical protein